jgi:hypothetical protein
MDQYEKAYERIGLSEGKRRELATLSRLSEEPVGMPSALLIEAVLISEKSHEITHMEISNAELVRTIR